MSFAEGLEGPDFSSDRHQHSCKPMTHNSPDIYLSMVTVFKHIFYYLQHDVFSIYHFSILKGRNVSIQTLHQNKYTEKTALCFVDNAQFFIYLQFNILCACVLYAQDTFCLSPHQYAQFSKLCIELCRFLLSLEDLFYTQLYVAQQRFLRKSRNVIWLVACHTAKYNEQL